MAKFARFALGDFSRGLALFVLHVCVFKFAIASYLSWDSTHVNINMNPPNITNLQNFDIPYGFLIVPLIQPAVVKYE